MAFAEDLLEQAYHRANLESGDPKQASLRWAVSTAYYALFHLPIDEAVGNWGVARQRSILARTFDHGKMKGICEDQVRAFYNSGQPSSADNEKLPLHSGDGLRISWCMPDSGREDICLGGKTWTRSTGFNETD